MPGHWTTKGVTPDEAVARIRSGMRVFVHGAAATPTTLIEALARRTDLENVTLYHLHTEGPAPFADPAQAGRFRSVSLFTGAPLRKAIAEGRADFVPIFLSDIPWLFLSGKVQLDAALLTLSPPDRHGFCTLGTSVDGARAAADTATLVIGEVTSQMPRTRGNSVVPVARLDAFTVTDRALHERQPVPESHVEGRIGEIVSGLIEDGSTLQVGIGAIPDAVLRRLGNKHDLGVHTEMFSDGIIDLALGGVITNKHKLIHPNRIVTSFVAGSRRLFDFVDDNPKVEFHPCDRTNDTAVIKRNPRAVAINSAIEIDLTGQVCADSFGHEIFSGIGGQMDFIRGSALSVGGKPIIALPSMAKNGTVSRIVSALRPGAGVVTTRGHVHWVVTEYGAVNLHGLSIRERGEALISIAHPDARAELRREMKAIRSV
ncbi:MAG: acetyl-CoA hydrolase/transferase family protein [Acidobacteria bacterium]|nr:acetyl-CoA hydrolase/transferase family protein [Acidobacteriota bacterium]